MNQSIRTFPHGVHPPECKHTKSAAISPMPPPAQAIILLSQHIGAPAKPLVVKGQRVRRGESVAAPGGFVSVPMHAPFSGAVARVDLALNLRGEMAPAIYIDRDEAADPADVVSRPRDVDAFSPGELVQAVQDSGVVGLGGAAFPTHVKLKVPEGKRVDTLIVNGCECEPYLTTDYRVMMEQSEWIIAGAIMAKRATGAREVVIAVENNKPEALDAMERAIPAGEPFSVCSLATKYPQGAEKMLSKAVLGKEVPSGGLPSDVGVACFNVATLAQIGRLLPRGEGLIERVVTVAGGGVSRPGNYLMPLGTPLRHVMEHAGMKAEARAIINGGPMMGACMPSLDIPLTKGTTGLLALTEDEMHSRDRIVYPCIRCARCLDACPIFLNPSMLGLLARKERYAEMGEQHHLADCFECGCCSHVCPSNIPLVHYFRIAKAVNRERMTAT